MNELIQAVWVDTNSWHCAVKERKNKCKKRTNLIA